MNPTSLNTQLAMLDRESIEQIIQHLPFDCLRNTRSGYHLVTVTPTGQRYLHQYCHTLRCRTCVRLRYLTLLQALLQACQVHHLTHFVTLTLPPSPSAPQLLRRSVGRFLGEARRNFSGLQYCWMVGVGRNRNLHLHLLVDRDIERAPHYGTDREWLRATWHRLTGAHQTKILPITAGTERRVINYMLVNMFGSVLSDLPLRRRYGCSRLIKLNPKPVRLHGVTYERRRGATGAMLRELGLVRDPIMNETFEIEDRSHQPGGVESPLRDGCAASVAPAGGRDLAGPYHGGET